MPRCSRCAQRCWEVRTSMMAISPGSTRTSSAGCAASTRLRRGVPVRIFDELFVGHCRGYWSPYHALYPPGLSQDKEGQDRIGLTQSHSVPIDHLFTTNGLFPSTGCVKVRPALLRTASAARAGGRSSPQFGHWLGRLPPNRRIKTCLQRTHSHATSGQTGRCRMRRTCHTSRVARTSPGL